MVIIFSSLGVSQVSLIVVYLDFLGSIGSFKFNFIKKLRRINGELVTG